jgi:hypothetical protein
MAALTAAQVDAERRDAEAVLEAALGVIEAYLAAPEQFSAHKALSHSKTYTAKPAPHLSAAHVRAL